MYLLYEKCNILVVEEKLEGNEQKEDQYFQKIYEQWKGAKAKDKDVTYKVIPKFYFKVMYTNKEFIEHF